MTKEDVEIRVVWDKITHDWAAIVPTPHGTCIGHARTPALALQKALRMAGQAAHEVFARS